MTTLPPVVDWNQWSLSYLGDLYGPLYGGHSVNVAATNTLQMWLPAYIEEMNRTLGVDVLTVPRNYEFRPDFSPAPPQDNRPQLLVNCPGTAGQPKRRSDGTQSIWKLQVGVWLYGGQDWRQVEALTYAYLAAIRATLLQHPSLGNFADAVYWISESYGEREHVGTRTVGEGTTEFQVSVLTSVQPFAGPTTPSLAPPGPLPTVEEVEVTVDNAAP